MSALDVALSVPKNMPIQPKCPPARADRHGARRDPHRAADRLGDLPGGDALLGHGVQHRRGGGGLHREAHQAGRVEAVDGGPAARSVVDVGRDAGAPREVDQGGDEATVARSVHRGGEPHHRRPDPAPGQRHGGLGGRHPRVRRGVRTVTLGADAARAEPQHAGRDHQRPPGAREDLAERVDGRAVGTGRLLHPGEVVVVAQVHDTLGRPGPGPQGAGVVEAAAVDLGAEGGHRVGRGVGAGEAHDLVARAEQFGHDGRSDPPGSAGDEQVHGDLPGRGGARPPT